MSALNKVQLIGRLGADPESRKFQNGGEIVNLRVATSETWRDKNTGEKKERTEWHSVSVFADHAVKFCKGYLRKGSLVYIEGKLETRKWKGQDGTDRYSTEVAIRPYGGEVQGLENYGDKSSGGRSDSGKGQNSSRDSGRDSGGGYSNDIDDEIPF